MKRICLPKRTRRGVLMVAVVGAISISAKANDIRWINSAGGTFGTTSTADWNSSGGVPPGTGDTAHFQVATSGTGPGYAINFTNSPTNQGSYVHRDNVTWNLGGNTYTQTGITGLNSFVVGSASGETGQLTISNGTVNTSDASSSLVTSIGEVASSIGIVTLQSGATWNDNADERIGDGGTGSLIQTGGTHVIGTSSVNQNLYLGFGSGALGTVSLSGGSLSVNGSAEVGGNLAIGVGKGAMTVSGTGQFAVSGDLHVYSTNSTFLSLQTGGTITTGTLTLASPTSFQWGGGTLNLTGSGFTVDSSGQLGAIVSLNAGQALNVTGGNMVLGTVSGSAVFSQTGTSAVTVGTSAVNRNLSIAASTNSSATYTISASNSLQVNGSAYVGGSSSGQGGGGSLAMSGGTASITGTLQIYGSAGSGVSLSGGVLSVPTVNDSGGFTQSGSGQFTISSFNMNSGASATFTNGTLTNFTGPSIGSATLNVGGNLAVNSSFNVVGPGGLNYTGAGTLNLFAHNITGSLNVSNGTVAVVGSASDGGTIIVNGSGALAGTSSTGASVNVSSGGTISAGTVSTPVSTLSVGSLNLGSGGRVAFDPGDRITVTNANGLNLSGATAVTVNQPFTGTSSIIGYSGTVSGSINNLSVPGGNAGTGYSFKNNTTNHTIDLTAKNIGTETLIAATGQAAAGGGTYSSLSAPVLNNNSQVAFAANINGAPQDGATNGIFRSDGNSTIAIARQFQSAAGSGLFNLLENPVINDQGQVAFDAVVTLPANGGQKSGIYRSDGTSLIQIVLDGQSAPGGGLLESSYLPRMNSSGRISWIASIDGSPSDGSGAGVFGSNGTSIVAIGRQNDAVFSPSNSTFSNVTVNDAGQTFFYNSSAGFVEGDGTSVKVLAGGFLADPNGSYVEFNLRSYSANNHGQIAFVSDLANDHYINGDQDMIRADSAGITYVANSDESAPGGGIFVSFGTPTLDDSSRSVFVAQLTNSADSATSGVFRTDGVTTVAFVRQNQSAPGGGTFSSFGAVVANNTGQAAFVGSVTIGASSNNGIFLSDGTDVLNVGEVGQTLSGSTITAISSPSVNNLGQVSYQATLANGTIGNFLFTPALHWRTASSGSWDTNTNWTLGLTPASVHDLIIDPANSLTVTGPAANTSIKSLTVGGGGAAATLQLNTGANVHLSGAISISNDGSAINFSSGNLTAASLSGPASSFSWTGGNLTLTSGGLVVDSTGPLGATVTVASGKSLSIGGNLQLNNGGSITQTGSGALVAGSITQAGGTLIAPSATIGTTIGSYSQSGGTATIGSAILSSGVSITQTAGTLSFSTSVIQSGGNFNGVSLNMLPGSTFTYTGGIFTGQLINGGTANLNADFTASNGLSNSGTTNVAVGVNATFNGAGLTNNGAFYFGGGAMTGPVINNGLLSGYGTLAGSGGFSNRSEFSQGAGNITLSNTGTNSNIANIDLAGGYSFILQSTTLTNTGTVNLNGAIVSGSGTLSNSAAGTIAGRGSISSTFTNGAGSTLLAQGGTLNVTNAFINAGIIQVASGASLTGGTITNNSRIQGAGNLVSNVINNGRIEPVAGTLTLFGTLTNPSGGTLTAATANQLLLFSGLSSNSGTIALNGGTIDDSASALTNTSSGQITGYGVLRTAGLTNDGTILFAAGSATLNGTLTNDSTAAVTVQNAAALFSNLVTNNGTFRVISGATATFAGGYSGGAVSNAFVNGGTFSVTSALVSTGNFTNSGTSTISGSQSWLPGTTFTNTAGSATFQTDTGSVSSAPLSINATGGAVIFSSGQHLAALSIASGATVTASISAPHSAIVTGSLSNAGLINLASNDLVVQNGNATNIANQLKTGSAGHWNGTGGILSSTAASDTRYLTTLGYRNGGIPFDGINNTTSSDVLIKYTYYGDADLNGSVNGADYAQIDTGFGLHLTGWVNGDFNYDGIVNGTDYSLIDNTFNQITATGASPLAIVTASAAVSAVPEPGSLLLGLGGAGFLFSRRRHPRVSNQMRNSALGLQYA